MVSDLWGTSQVAEANRQWMEEEDGIVDDCTVIVIYLDITPPSPLQTQDSPLEAGSLPLCGIAPPVSAQRRRSTGQLEVDRLIPKTSSGQLSAEKPVSKTLGQAARKASSLLTAREFMAKCNIGLQKSAR